MKYLLISDLVTFLCGVPVEIFLFLGIHCGHLRVVSPVGFIIIYELLYWSMLVYMSRHLWLVLIDLLFVGVKEEKVYFSCSLLFIHVDNFTSKYVAYWKFYSSRGTIILLVPLCVPINDIHLYDPSPDQMLHIKYLKCSKILVSWECLSPPKKGKYNKFLRKQKGKQKDETWTVQGNTVSGYYSSIIEDSRPLRVRDWLAGQSFESQTDFGLEIIRKIRGY